MVLTALEQLLDPFVEGEEGAGNEDEDGGKEGPEEALFTVAKGMLFVRRGITEIDADEEEDLVDSIGDRVCSLCQHRHAARE
jgi:hypothetical protein